MGAHNVMSRILVAGVLVLTLVGSAGAFQLISADEAKLPDDDTKTRSIFFGPRVLLIEPPPKAGYITSPFPLRVRFEPRGGSRVVVESIVVTYKKRPSIDLTQRIRPFVQASGLELKDVVVPPGEHRIRVDVRDSDGRAGSSEFTIRVRN